MTQSAVLTTDTAILRAANRLSQVATGGVTRSYTYNAANRMSSVTKNGVVQAEYNWQNDPLVAAIPQGLVFYTMLGGLC